MTPATFHPERSWLNEEAARNTHSMSFTAPVSQERGAPPLLNPLLWMMVRKRWMSSLAQSEATQGRYGPGSQILAQYIEVSSGPDVDTPETLYFDYRRYSCKTREAQHLGRGNSPRKTTFAV